MRLWPGVPARSASRVRVLLAIPFKAHLDGRPATGLAHYRDQRPGLQPHLAPELKRDPVDAGHGFGHPRGDLPRERGQPIDYLFDRGFRADNLAFIADTTQLVGFDIDSSPACRHGYQFRLMHQPTVPKTVNMRLSGVRQFAAIKILSMEFLRGGSLILAVFTMGLMAGVFQLYSHTVMRGLAKSDDKTFVEAFRAMDRAIMNPLFLATFLGAFVFTALATVFSLGSQWRSLLPWLIAALVLYFVVLLLTFRVNVPRNNDIKTTTDPDLAAVRKRFDEARWTRSNDVRAWLSTAAFACLAWALVVYGGLSMG